jgi:hypothetical protein
LLKINKKYLNFMQLYAIIQIDIGFVGGVCL